MTKIIYSDSEDHFNNGVLRLLNITKEEFDEWIYLSEQFEGDLLSRLRCGFHKLKGVKPIWRRNISNDDVVLYEKIHGTNYHVALSESLGWLIDSKYEMEKLPPVYEEDYFEGNKNIHGGYGNYIDQKWRIEKSTKQVDEIRAVTGLINGSILDVGSGYGFLRKAFQEAGYEHYGVEISQHANQISKQLYGFEGLCGKLSNYIDEFYNKFDLIFMGDVIEHVPEPIELLKNAYSSLKEGGFLVVKTPNINCPERDLFGSFYHSFKREHLFYFSHKSVVDFAKIAGFSEHRSFSKSHLLQGFLSKEQINEYEQNMEGSDLVVYLIK